MSRTPTLIRGVLYASQAEAARALGVQPCTVANALRRGRADGVGTTPGRARPPHPPRGARHADRPPAR